MSEVLEQLGKQAQATFQVEEEDDRDLVTLDLKNATFWEAMDALGRATGRINDSANRDKPQIDFERKARRPRLVYNDGSFRVELRSISASRQIDLSEVSDRSEPTPQPRQLRLNFDARSAPHLSILAVDHIEIEQADDENGKPLMVEPIDAGGLNETPVFIESMRVDLNKVTDASRRLSRLRGVVWARVLVEKKRVVISESFVKAEGKKSKIGEDLLEIEKASKTEGACKLSIDITSAEGSPGLNWSSRIYVQDAAGERMHPNAIGRATRNNHLEISLEYDAEVAGITRGPKRIIAEDWVTILHPIRFDFRDIPLP